MNEFRPLYFRLFAAPLALLAMLPGESLAVRDCDVVMCGSPHYHAYWPSSTPHPCDYPIDCSPPTISGMAAYLIEAVEPPSPAFLNCEGLGGGYFCEAYPQGSHLSYEWSTDGGIYIPYPTNPSSPFLTVSCWGGMPGSVAVTVVSPFGMGATATRTLPACGM
jgi:hypothetical protein